MTNGSPDPFARVAPLYAVLAHRGEVSALQVLLQARADDWVLDVGGGTGRVASRLLAVARGVVVVDPSEAMLRQTRPEPGLHQVRAVAEALPFPNGAFPRIVVVDAFHHFASRPAATRELWRVLAPGGRLIVEEPDIRRRAVRAIAFGEWLLRFGSIFWEPPRIASAFTNLGATATLIPNHGYVSHILVEKAGRQQP
jgi:demethylmenaquinone methyltransferase/2-methoxy-6-polyprenyl-1,4-benzoquinol methylase